MSDVLIVGAGPAGIAAAQTLVESGANVVVIDRRLIPGGKACAGGLTRAAWSLAGIDPANPPSYARTFAKFHIRSSLGKTSFGEDNRPVLVTVDRTLWQMDRIEHLRKLGVEISLGERLLAIGDRSVSTDLGTRKFDWLVGADGAISRTRRLMGLKQGSNMRARQIRIRTKPARNKSIETQRPVIWFDHSFVSPAYAWSFPWVDEIRIGLAVSTECLESGAHSNMFTNWLEKLGLGTSGQQMETGTIGCNYSGHRFGRVVLAGDAAGLASPLTGEGIAQALISGKEAALEILDPNYRSRTIAQLARMHRRTLNALSVQFFGRPALALAPYLLRIPLVRKETLRRYV